MPVLRSKCYGPAILSVPLFDDEVVHFAKPPFTYWVIAGGITLFGHNEWGVRLENVLAFLATVVVVYWMGRTFTPSRPWLPALIYATFPVPFGAANIMTTDTLLTLWEGIAVLGFVRWWESEDRSYKQVFLMWGGFGMAFLTKGPPGLLPLVSILVFVLLADGWRSASRLVFLKGPVLIGLLAITMLLLSGSLVCAGWVALSPPNVSSDWSLYGVHFTSADEGWAVGSDIYNGKGVILHFVDESWTSIAPALVSLEDLELFSVHFTSATEGWTAGRDNWNGRGVLLRYSIFPEIKVTASSIDFGNVSAGKTSEKKITIQNMGGVNLTIDTIGSVAAPFGRSGGPCTDGQILIPNAACTLLIQFAPLNQSGFFLLFL